MMRLDKFLAECGFGTRKEVKQIIRKECVLVNDVQCKKEEFKIDEFHDIVCVNGEPVQYHEYHYFLLNKPQGVISATEDLSLPTVLDLIHEPVRDLFPVGRLDRDTEGLLLITNDGILAHELLSPKKHVEKCYFLKISNPLTEEHVRRIENGIEIDQGEMCKPAKVQIIDDTSLKLWITEGKFHQIKRMMIACDSEVTYLQRLSMGPLLLDPSLKLGEYRTCTEKEIEDLLAIKERKK